MKTYLQEKLTTEQMNAVNSGITAADVAAIGTAIQSSAKGVANGVASLDGDGKVPSSQLPSYVDDVVEGYKYNGNFYRESTHTTQITPETDKIYVDLSTNTTWRYGGSTYVQISSSLSLGETSSTAYRGDRGKTAYDHTSLTNNPHSVTKSQVGLGNVPNVTTNNQTPTFSQAGTRANIASGETLTTIFGKIAKWFNDIGSMAFETASNYVLKTLKINNKPLSSDVTLSGEDINVTTPVGGGAGITIADTVDSLWTAVGGKQDAITSSNKLAYSLISGTPTIPTALSQLSADATHRTVTDTEKSTWNGKQNALGFTPYNATNPSGYQTASQVSAAISAKIGSDEDGVWIDV